MTMHRALFLGFFMGLGPTLANGQADPGEREKRMVIGRGSGMVETSNELSGGLANPFSYICPRP